MPSERRTVGKAVGWLVSLRWMIRGLGIGRTLILSSILLPVDFGRAILAISIVLFVEAVTELRVDYSLIRSKDNPDSLYDAAWTMQIIRGALCALAIGISAPFIGSFYEDPLLVAPLYLLALAVAIGGFVNVGMAQFYKDMDFRKVFVANLASRVAALVVSVVYALITGSFWAIVVGYLVQRIVDVLVSYWMHSRRPKLGLASAGEIGEHSKWLWLQGVLFQILLRADIFLIGKFAGPAALGPYYLAKMIAELIGTEMSTGLRVALYSQFVREEHETEGEAQKVQAFRSLSLATLLSLLVGAPLSLLLGLCAADLVGFALEKPWAPAAEFLQLFSLNALFGVAAAAPSASMLANGHTRLVAVRQAIGLVVFVPTLWLATQSFGLVGAAAAVIMTTAAGAAFCITVAVRDVPGDWRRFWLDLLRIVLALFVMVWVVLAVLAVFPDVSERWNPLHILRMAAATLVGLGVYALVIWWQWTLRGRPDGFERNAGTFLASVGRKLRRRA